MQHSREPWKDKYFQGVKSSGTRWLTMIGPEAREIPQKNEMFTSAEMKSKL